MPDTGIYFIGPNQVPPPKMRPPDAVRIYQIGRSPENDKGWLAVFQWCGHPRGPIVRYEPLLAVYHESAAVADLTHRLRKTAETHGIPLKSGTEVLIIYQDRHELTTV